MSEPFKPPTRLLLGAGPSQVPQAVLEAMAAPTIGHFDPAFLDLTERISALLRELFRTGNELALALPATGSGGAAALADSFCEPGDRVVVGVIGVFGERLAEAFARVGAEVVRVEAPWGEAIEPERLIGAIDERTAAVALVHGETSTGVAQPLDGVGPACRAAGALLLVDCVTSLGGLPVLVDEWAIDVAFSGTQKCLNCPPGLAPMTAGPRALERLARRSEPPRSWYFDVSMIHGYWNPGQRSYHHTAPINMLYGLHEALRLIDEEGLPERWRRHAAAHAALRAAASAWGLDVLAGPELALWPLTALVVPEGVDEAPVRAGLLERDGIEISGGLGSLAGRIWRVGLMGAGARLETVELIVGALSRELTEAGHPCSAEEALAEARSAYDAAEPGLPV